MASNVFAPSTATDLQRLALGARREALDPKAKLEAASARFKVPANVLLALAEAEGDADLTNLEANARDLAAAAGDAGDFRAALQLKTGDKAKAQAIGRRANEIMDAMQPQEAKAPAAEEGEPGLASDLSRSISGAATKATGGAVSAAGIVADAAGRAIYGEKDEGGAGTRLGRATRATGDFITDRGQATLDRRSESAKKAAIFDPDADITKPSTWGLSEDASISGALNIIAEGLGSMAPTVLAGLVSGGAGAAVGAATSGGAAAQEAEDTIDRMAAEIGPDGKSRLEAESDTYRALIAEGKTPDEALDFTKQKMRGAVTLAAGAVGGVGGAATSSILHKPLGAVAGRGMAGRVAGTAAISGAEEGTQEVGETVAQRAAMNASIGTHEDLTKGTLNDFVGSALAGGPIGAISGAANAPAAEQERADLFTREAAGETTAEPAPTPSPAQPPSAPPAAPLALGARKRDPLTGEVLPPDGAVVPREPDAESVGPIIDHQANRRGLPPPPLGLPGPEDAAPADPFAIAPPPGQAALPPPGGPQTLDVGSGSAPVGPVAPVPVSQQAGAAPIGPLTTALSVLGPQPEPEPAPPMPKFPDQGPGSQIRLAGTDGTVADAVFMGETPEGNAVVRADGIEHTLSPVDFDKARTLALRIDEAAKASPKGGKPNPAELPAPSIAPEGATDAQATDALRAHADDDRRGEGAAPGGPADGAGMAGPANLAGQPPADESGRGGPARDPVAAPVASPAQDDPGVTDASDVDGAVGETKIEPGVTTSPNWVFRSRTTGRIAEIAWPHDQPPAAGGDVVAMPIADYLGGLNQLVKESGGATPPADKITAMFDAFDKVRGSKPDQEGKSQQSLGEARGAAPADTTSLKTSAAFDTAARTPDPVEPSGADRVDHAAPSPGAAPVATEDTDNGPLDPQSDRDGADQGAAQPAAAPEPVSGPPAQTQQNAPKVGGRSADQSAVKTASPVRSGSGRDFLSALNRAKGKAKAAIRDAGTADYLAPGNIIASYGGGHDRVVAFDPGTKDITVQAVKRDNTGGWVDAPGEGQRTHRTLPDDRQLANGPVQRAERPAGSPEEISPAPQQVQAETGDDQGNVQKLHTAQPTGEITRKPIKPGKAITARGREIAVEYALVELDDLTASQLDDGRDNPAFPQELQPRDRSGNRSQEQIRKIAADIRPELLGENPQASAGAPIATKGGVVISGNGRTLALRRAYADGTAGGYRAWLKQQGYPEGSFKRPVLIRTIDEDMDTDTLAATAREANERDTQAMSASEQAMADAKVLSPAVLDLYRGGEVDAAGNRDFVRGFLGQVVAPAEMGNLIRDDGSMTQDAVRRVQAALLARSYGDADLVGAVMEATDGSIKAIGGALMDAAPRWAQMRDAAKDGVIAGGMDQTEALLEAVRIVDRARRAGRKVDEFVGQGDMFSGDAVSPMGKAFLTLMFRDAPASYRTARGRERLARGLILFADEGMRSQSGTDMLGATADPIGAAAGVRRKLVDDEGKSDAVRKGQGGLFAAGNVSDGAGDGQDVPAGAGPAGPAEPADAGGRDPQAGESGQREGLTTDFVRAPDGSLSFGEITAKIAERIGRQRGHIRLRNGDPAKGLQHIEQRHGEHIRSLGYPSVEAFVSQVGRGFQAVYARQGRALDLVLDDGKKGLLIVQLEPDASGDFYDVRTATPIRRGQYAKKKPLWESAGPSVSPIDGPLDPKGQNGTDNVGADDSPGKTAPLSTGPANAVPGTMEQRDIDRPVVDEVVGAGQRPAVNLNPIEGQVFAPALEGSNFHYDLSTDRGDAEGGAANRVDEARSGSTSRQSGNGGVKQQSASMSGQAAYGLEDNPVEINLDIEPVPVNAGQTITPEAARRINAAAAEALARAGLLGKIGLRVEAGRVTGAGGTYAKGVISILRDRGRGWLHTLDHEMIHALRDPARWGASHGLFTAGEWRALVRAARADADLMAAVRAAYPDLDAAGQMEEAVAEMFADWAAGRREVDGGPLRSALEAIRSFFRAVASALRGEGFEDAARVMERIARGEVGGRGPDGPGGGGGYDRQSPRRTERSTARLRDLWGDRSPSPRLGTLNMDADHDSVKDQRKPSLTVADVIAAAKRTGHAPEKAETGAAAEWVTRAAEDAGIDMSGLRHVIDGSAVRHIFGRHGGASSEARRGQVAITESDIEQIGTIIADPDAVAFGSKTRIGRDAITYVKGMPDGTVLLVEEIRQSRGEAAVNTMWKKTPAAKDAYAPRRILLSNVRNDGGTVIKVFTKAEAVKEQRDLSEIRAAMTARARNAGRAFGSQGWRAGSDFWSDLLTDAMGRYGAINSLALVPGRPLFTELGKGIKAAQDYLRLKTEMDAQRDTWHGKADDVAQAWGALGRKDGKANRAMMDIMHEATIAQVDPSLPFVPRDVNANDSDASAAETVRRLAHADLSARFDALPQPFKELFVRVRDTYSDLADDIDKALVENIQNAADISVSRAERAHAAEMRRIEDEGLEGAERAAALAKADDALAAARQRAQSGVASRAAALRKAFESNRLAGPYFPLARFGNFFVTVRDADGKVVEFSRFETAAQQRAAIEELAATEPDLKVQSGVLDAADLDLSSMVDPSFVKDVMDALGAAGADEALMDAIWQRWLETLPDQSIRKAHIHRKGRAGYNADAFRAFGKTMFHGAHQLARLRFGLRMGDALDRAKEEAAKAKDPARAGFVVQEMQRRHNFAMNPKGNPLTSTLTGIGFVWYLGMSPAAALVNVSQTTMIGPPILAARFQKAGVSGAVRHLGRAMRDFTVGKGLVSRSGRLTADEKAAMEEAYRIGTISRTQSHDLAAVADSGVEYSERRERVMRIIGGMFHHAERFNREVTYLAAYRMAREAGEGHQAAIQTAADLTWKTHFDFQNSSRPRVMQGDVAKVALLFRSYSVNLLWRLFRDSQQALTGATAEDRREARTQLIGITLSMMAHAGIKGTWGFGIAMMLLGMFFPGGDDDAERWLQDALLMEGDDVGTAAWNWLASAALVGVPGRVTNIDLTNRIGSPNLWFRDGGRTTEGTDTWNALVGDLLGPIGGLGASAFMAAGMVGEDPVRALEKVVPKAARDPIKALRYATDGVTTMNGDPVVENVSALELLAQASGFTPARISERYEANNRMKNEEKRIVDERQRLHKDLGDAIAKGEGIGDRLAERMLDFNRRYPEYPITSESLRASMRSRQRAKDRNEGGVNLNPKLDQRLRDNEPTAMFS